MKKTLIFVLSLVFSGLAFAEYNSSNIPDSAEIRRSCADSWFKCPVDQIRSQKEKFVKNNIGFQFQIRLEEDDKFYQIVVAPKSEISIDFNNNGVHRMEKADVYSKTACGSWVLYRDKKKGNCTKIVWYFNADSDVYLQLREENKKTFADLVVFGGFIARHVPVGITFEKACVSSFADIKRLTKTSLPWNKVQVLPGQYKDSVAMVYQIRKNLSSIIHVDDACYDEKGVLKSIFTQKPYNFAALEEKDADFMIHLGDVCNDEYEIERKSKIPVRFIKGNNDWSRDLTEEAVISLGGHKIFATHGHKHRVYYGIDILAYAAMQKECDIVLFGHTHVPVIKYESALTFVNPGSLTYPRQVGGKPSYAILNFKDGNLDIRIEYI